ncbi:MAG: isoprenylcysteine carboxylmethyltransferase family protein [Hyphomonadaceae bacterium]
MTLWIKKSELQGTSSKIQKTEIVMNTLKSRKFWDRFEQAALLVLFGWLVIRIWPEDILSINSFALLLLISEGAVVAILLFRRSTEQISMRPWDWFIATVGTFAALLVSKGGDPISISVGLPMMVTGMVIHIGAKLSLNRSFGIVAANRGVKITGMYRFVRHPMYAGYMISHVGYLLLAPSFWNLAVYVFGWAFLVARIYAEERILSEDSDYRSFKENVRYRLVPGAF